MTRVMRSEWLKLLRRGMLAAFATATAVTILGTVLTVMTAGQAKVRGGPGGGGVTLEALTSANGLRNALTYALPLESIVGGVIGGASRWLPGKLLAAVASGGNDVAGFSAALLTLTVYAVIAVSVALVVFRRRDVAS
jgi:hypothetical protein